MAAKAYVVSMTVSELKEELKLRGLSTKGSKKNLRDRLEQALYDEELDDPESEAESDTAPGYNISQGLGGFNFEVPPESFIAEEDVLDSDDSESMIVSVQLSNRDRLEVHPCGNASSRMAVGVGDRTIGDGSLSPMIVAIELGNSSHEERYGGLPSRQVNRTLDPVIVAESHEQLRVQEQAVGMNGQKATNQIIGTTLVTEAASQLTSTVESSNQIASNEQASITVHADNFTQDTSQSTDHTAPDEQTHNYPQNSPDPPVQGSDIDTEAIRTEHEEKTSDTAEDSHNIVVVSGQTQNTTQESSTQHYVESTAESDLPSKVEDIDVSQTTTPSSAEDGTGAPQEMNAGSSVEQVAGENMIESTEHAMEPAEQQSMDQEIETKLFTEPEQPEGPSMEPEQPEGPSMEPEQPEGPSMESEQPEGPSMEPEQPEGPSMEPEQPEGPSMEPVEPATDHAIEQSCADQDTVTSTEVEQATTESIEMMTNSQSDPLESNVEPMEVDSSTVIISAQTAGVEREESAPSEEEVTNSKTEDSTRDIAQEAPNDDMDDWCMIEAPKDESEEQSVVAKEEAEEQCTEVPKKEANETVLGPEDEELAADEATKEETEEPSAEKAPRDEMDEWCMVEAPKDEVEELCADSSAEPPVHEAANEEIEELPVQEAANKETEELPVQEAAKEETEELPVQEAAKEETEGLTVDKVPKEKIEEPPMDEAAKEEIEVMEETKTDLTWGEAAKEEIETSQGDEEVKEKTEDQPADEAVKEETEEPPVNKNKTEQQECDDGGDNSPEHDHSTMQVSPDQEVEGQSVTVGEQREQSLSQTTSQEQPVSQTTPEEQPSSQTTTEQGEMEFTVHAEDDDFREFPDPTIKSHDQNNKSHDQSTKSHDKSHEQRERKERRSSRSDQPVAIKKRRISANVPAVTTPTDRKRRWGSGRQRSNSGPSPAPVTSDLIQDIIPTEVSQLAETGQLDSVTCESGDSVEGVDGMTATNETPADKEQKQDERSLAEQETRRRIEARLKAKREAEQEAKRQLLRRRSPSPSKHEPGRILHIEGLTRPFTKDELRELLSQDGPLMEEAFWIDKIRSHCIAVYISKDVAMTTRQRVHGIKWPLTNPKYLSADFLSAGEVSRITESQLVIQEEGDSVDDVEPPAEAPVAMETEEEPARPTMMLDELFRKTKATPSIYWLPLTDTQIAERAAREQAAQEEREKQREERRKARIAARELEDKERNRRLMDERERRARDRVRGQRSRSRSRDRPRRR